MPWFGIMLTMDRNSCVPGFDLVRQCAADDSSRRSGFFQFGVGLEDTFEIKQGLLFRTISTNIRR